MVKVDTAPVCDGEINQLQQLRCSHISCTCARKELSVHGPRHWDWIISIATRVCGSLSIFKGVLQKKDGEGLLLR